MEIYEKSVLSSTDFRGFLALLHVRGPRTTLRFSRTFFRRCQKCSNPGDTENRRDVCTTSHAGMLWCWSRMGASGVRREAVVWKMTESGLKYKQNAGQAKFS